jgi:pyruvate dehydrogenase E1 component beta subunit
MEEAIALEMRRDPSIFLMGEDIAALGGVWGYSRGLLAEFGGERVRDTPISEAGFIGAAVGAAMHGMRPIVELMFVDFVGVCLDAIYNLAAKQSYHSAGRIHCPMVITTAYGGGYGDATQHSQTLFATFGHMPGLKVVAPSNAYDAKGLLISAIRDDNPVVFMFHKAMQGMGWLGTIGRSINDVPDDDYTVPIGQASVVREGTDLSIVALGWTVHQALDAADELAREGISADVIDCRSVQPLDRASILRSARKTGRLLVADEDFHSFGFAAEIVATVAEAGVPLRSAPLRVTYPDIPPPFSPPMERFALPDVAKIAAAARVLCKG